MKSDKRRGICMLQTKPQTEVLVFILKYMAEFVYIRSEGQTTTVSSTDISLHRHI
jgi:hypothetical protein